MHACPWYCKAGYRLQKHSYEETVFTLVCVFYLMETMIFAFPFILSPLKREMTSSQVISKVSFHLLCIIRGQLYSWLDYLEAIQNPEKQS